MSAYVALQEYAEKFKRIGEELTLGLVGKESINLGDGTVESNDIEAVISSVQDQVLAHDSQADEAEISSRFIVSICGSSCGHRCRCRLRWRCC